ncbi:Cullin-associated NEDD8-dissociated protein 1 [Spathaspora sp. JA1]|nr:Cullin-associated NEDD8-dissociated protein 1 [Spathaspora sp. JA1]
MPDLNIRALKDKAMDVDPDIRFMALEDFRKGLETDSGNQNSGQLESFFPTLLKLLDDQNPDVQNQAVKSFEPMVRYLSNDGLLSLIKSLFALVPLAGSNNTTSTNKSFTISIPNMALRSLFAQSNSRDNSDFVSDKLSTSNYRFNVLVARTIMDYLIPQITSREVTIDTVELLIDLVTEIGYVLNENEVLKLSLYLVQVAFKETGIIGKNSIVALEKIFALTKEVTTVEAVLQEVKRVEQATSTSDRLFHSFQLYSVCLKRGIKPSTNTINEIYDAIVATLNVQNVEITEDDDDIEEDVDFDAVLQENLLKDEAFTTLINLVSQGYLPVELGEQVFELIKIFLRYDPLNSDSYDDFDNEDDDDIEFSDDELDGAADEENDCSWKLRAKASILVPPFLKEFPSSLGLFSETILPILPIEDSNDQVISEAVRAAVSIINSTSENDLKNIQAIIPIIISRLETIREEQFPVFLKLIESFNRFQYVELAEATFACFNKRNITTSGSLDYLQFYSSVLESYDTLPTMVIEYIADDFITNLSDKSFNMISETVKSLTLLFNHANANKISEYYSSKIVDGLILKIQNNKLYTSDLVRLCITALGEILCHGLSQENEKIFEVFKISISNESTSKVTVDVLNEILSSEAVISKEYALFIMEKSSTLIISSNEATSKASLILLNNIIQRIPPSELKGDIELQNLIELLRVSTKEVYKYVFQACNYLSVHIFSSEIYRMRLLQTIIQLVNEGNIEVGDESFFEFVKTSCNFDKGLFSYLQSNLDSSSETSARILAICALGNNLDQEIKARIDLFQKFAKSDFNNKQFIPVLRFLGYIGKERDIRPVSINVLLDLLKNEKLTNEVVISSASSTLGLIASRDISSSLKSFANNYKSNDSNIRGYLMDALKIVVDNCSAQESEKVCDFIWKLIFNFSIQFDKCSISELRKSGEVLGKIITLSSSKRGLLLEYCKKQPALREVYLILVIIKSLLSSTEISEGYDEFLSSLIKSSISWIDIINIDIRQIVVGNLLTGLHNKPLSVLPNLNDSLLPKIFQQLKAEDAFKKVITMGPYKYVMDQGLEIRKLSYEFIYTLISLESSTLEQYNVSIETIFNNIINVGLSDDQADITVLSCINLIHLISNHDSDAMVVIINNKDGLFNTMIKNLNLQLGKKLSAKASAQDNESYQERIKSIVKLSKKFNQIIEKVYSTNPEIIGLIKAWRVYCQDLRTQFQIYYNSTESE